MSPTRRMKVQWEWVVGRESTTILSIFAVLIVALCAHVRTTRLTIEQHTIHAISAISTNETLSDSDYIMTQLINGNIKLDGDIKGKSDRFVINLLDYYEFLAMSVNESRTMDKNLVLKVRGGPMSRAWNVCERYVNDRRESLGAPNLYREYQRLVEEYNELDLGL